MVLGNEAKFLSSVAESLARNSTAAQRQHCLIRLKSFIASRFFQVQPRVNALRSHLIVRDEKSHSQGRDHDGRQEVREPDSSDQEERAADRREHQRVPNIRLFENQAGHNHDYRARNKDASLPALHLAQALLAVPRQRDDQRKFGEFRWLKTDPSESKPTPCMAPDHPDVWHQNENEHDDRRPQQQPPPFVEEPIIEAGCSPARYQTGNTPDQLHCQIARSRLFHARAVEHHHPQRQQTANAKYEGRSEEHTSELQSRFGISYAVSCLKN